MSGMTIVARKTPIERYRNIGICAHIDAGKTTTTERILFYTGVRTRSAKCMTARPPWTGWSRNRSAASPSRRRRPPASGRAWTAPSRAPHQHHRYARDTLTSPSKSSARCACSMAPCMVYCAVGGVQPQSETVWRQANKYGVPRLAFVNKMDRAGADFFKRLRPDRGPPARQSGAGADADRRRRKVRRRGRSGPHEGHLLGRCQPGHEVRVRATSRPNSRRRANEWREKMVEAAAEANEELMNKYLEDGELTEDEIKLGLRMRTIADEIVPMLLRLRVQEQGRAGHAGCRDRLHAVADGHSAGQGLKTTDGGPTRARPATTSRLPALAFKIMTDPFVGQLIFFRVYSGVLNSGDTIYNPIKGKKERIGRHPADARQRAQGNQGSACRRYRRRGGAERRHHRRHPVRSGQASSRWNAWCSRSR